MRLLGIDWHWPSQRALVFTTSVTAITAIVLTVLQSHGMIDAVTVPRGTAAILVGSLAHDCGLSIEKDGIRAAGVLFIILILLVIALSAAGFGS